MSEEYAFEFEPEDAWDHDDPVPDQIHNLCVRCALLDGGPRLPEGPGENTPTDMMQELIERVRSKLKHRGLSRRDVLRGNQLLEDANFVLGRIMRGE